MNAIVLSIGQELITGHVIDTNSGYLSRQLGQLGIETVAHWTVGDDLTAIEEALRAAAAQADIVLVTGGLGPTLDDLTRDGLAKAMGCELRLDEGCLGAIEERFARLGRSMSDINRRQALIPLGAEAMPNPCGTAPGIIADLGGTKVFVMPGVPSEMARMFAESVAPRLGPSGSVIVHRQLHAFGAGESDIAARLGDLMRPDANPTVGTTASSGLITVRITARAAQAHQAKRLADAAAAEVRDRLGELVIASGDETISSALGRLLRARGATLASAESCTGGLVGRLITDTPGASEYYLGGVVAYSNRVKSQLLGVTKDILDTCGAVSEATAAAMASGCRGTFGADWALAVTGIAGPGGGSDDKPVGLVYIAVAGPDVAQTHRHIFPYDRDQVRRRAATTALNHLRLALAGRQRPSLR